MTEPNDESRRQDSPQDRDPLSPDDLVHAYGGFLIIAVPVIIIVLILWLVLR